jgi:hypothetical protein
MSMLFRTFLLLFSLTCCLVPARAQESGLAFLKIGTNAAAMALGDAYVAHSRDAYSTYWNPAGLAAARFNSVAISHHLWIGDVRTYALASRFRAGERGGIGLFITATGSGDLEAREGPGDPDGFFSAQFAAVGLSYGHRFGPLRLGASAKYLTERIYTYNANGFAVDAGAQVDLAAGAVQLGAAVQNLGRMSELLAEATQLPRIVRVGAAIFPFRILTQDDGLPLLNTFLTGEVSYILPDEQSRLHVGVAAEVLELVVVRVGMITGEQVRRFSAGAGIGYGSFVVDYAFLPFQSDFGGSGHVLTLDYHW